MNAHSTLLISRERRRDLVRAAAAADTARDLTRERHPAATSEARTAVRFGAFRRLLHA